VKAIVATQSLSVMYCAWPPRSNFPKSRGFQIGKIELVANGRISGVIDWGDMAPGDRATDLAAS
jgi:hypothetical protein